MKGPTKTALWDSLRPGKVNPQWNYGLSTIPAFRKKQRLRDSTGNPKGPGVTQIIVVDDGSADHRPVKQSGATVIRSEKTGVKVVLNWPEGVGGIYC